MITTRIQGPVARRMKTTRRGFLASLIGLPAGVKAAVASLAKPVPVPAYPLLKWQAQVGDTSRHLVADNFSLTHASTTPITPEMMNKMVAAEAGRFRKIISAKLHENLTPNIPK